MRILPTAVAALLVIPAALTAQIGGEATYRFLSLTHSARMAALGGSQVAVNDSADLNLPFHNPALLREAMANQLSFSYVDYLESVSYGYASYAFRLKKDDSFIGGTFAAGMHYINYGNFLAAGEDGQLTGENFHAGEYALLLTYGGRFRNWRYGVTLKPVLSVFERYNSFGLAADAGVAWFSESNLLSLGMAARNAGSQLTTYYEDGDREPIPFELQAGFSGKLAHAPLVFHLTARHLNHWVLAKPEEEENGEISFLEPAEGFGKQLMRHLVMGAEITPSPAFTLRAGYNYNLRQALKHEERLSTVGFSLGFGVRIRRFRLDYANTRYHVAGSSNHLSLAIGLNRNF